VRAADFIIGLVLTFLVVAVLAGVAIYNRLVRSRNRVREAWSGIDVQLRQRASLVPNLVEAVRGYMAHERGVFEEVARARAALQQAGGAAAAASANNALSQALGRLFAVVENYPTLRASENFAALQRELSDVEEKIAFARQFYNRNVLDYNTRVETFPGVLVASNLGFSAAEFFETGDEGRAEVTVSLAPAQAPRPRPADAPPSASPPA
jgi:LemA protein